ncbi:MAG: GGDEF domain-containing protein [Salaquimonas sp.]|nr:GGDEF domain-containing protein [Salaquimonas sp.]
MQEAFDPLALMVPSCFVMAFAGFVMAGAYWRKRGEKALCWWSIASLTDAAAIALMIYGYLTNIAWAPGAGGVLVTLGSALHWVAIRHFNRRRASVPIVAGSLFVPAVAGGLASFIGLGAIVPVAANFAITSVFYFSCAWELWSTRDEKLAYRWSLAGLLALHGFVFSGGFYDVLTGVFVASLPPSLFSWFGLIHFESLAFTIGATTALLILVRERSANRAIHSAASDPLTGTQNRKFVFESAERLYQRCRETRSPVSVVMFDLDHFKKINDTLGHDSGDKVITGFAEILRTLLRPNDLFTRYGGEEFILILPNVSDEAAGAIAERTRIAFAEAFRFIDGYPIQATVSAGVAEANHEVTLEMAIHLADSALYSAKNAGRNSICHAGGKDDVTSDNIVRIA